MDTKYRQSCASNSDLPPDYPDPGPMSYGNETGYSVRLRSSARPHHDDDDTGSARSRSAIRKRALSVSLPLSQGRAEDRNLPEYPVSPPEDIGPAPG